MRIKLNELFLALVAYQTFQSRASALWLGMLQKNLRVTFDSSLKFDKQVPEVVRRSFWLKLSPFLNKRNLETAIHAFISSRLDYCIALYVGFNQSSISRLQVMQKRWRSLFNGNLQA